MIGLLLRFFARRFRWVVLGAVGRWLVQLVTNREVARVADELDDRMPEKFKAAAERLPGDPVRASAQAVVAGRSIQKAAGRSVRVSRAANDVRRRLGRQEKPGSVSARLIDELGSDWKRATELADRELRANRARATDGDGSADDMLLDLRNIGGVDNGHGSPSDRDSLTDDVAPPIASGRPKRSRLKRSLVPRMQRTYRPPMKPWDR